MKKRLFLSLATLFVCCCTLIGVVNAEAETGKTTVTARVPETVPTENDTLHAILDTKFDFSKISFSTDSGIDTIQGKADIRKILITANPNMTGEGDVKGESWFSVYCLDGSLKYPQYSLNNINPEDGFDALNDTVKMQVILMAALFNDENHTDLFKKADGYIIDPTITYSADTDVTAVLDAVSAGTTVTVNVEKLVYYKPGGDELTITAAELAGDTNVTQYPVEIVKENIMFDKYDTENIHDKDKDYNHALWIIEHSYPTLDLREALEVAGADYLETIVEAGVLESLITESEKANNLSQLQTITACTNKSEIATMFDVTEDEVTSEFCQSKIDGFVEQVKLDDYVYSTVQYAIWKVTDGIDINDNKLGDTLYGSDQLNKLYGYLIKERNVYTNYSTYEYGNTIEVEKPASGKDLYKQTDDAYIYGPYSISHKLYELKTVSLGFVDTVEGITYIDESGNEITSITDGETFYVKVPKDNKMTELNIRLKTEEAYTMYPASDKGRIYYAYYPNAQNVVSGGKLYELSIEKDITLHFNPKTGEENIAVIFVIALIIGSLGFVALSYRNKPVELN